jgi:hypothetical protein
MPAGALHGAVVSVENDDSFSSALRAGNAGDRKGILDHFA